MVFLKSEAKLVGVLSVLQNEQSSPCLRGNDLKLRHRFSHLARRKACCSVRIVEPWNNLPPFDINSPSLVVFKNQLDACRETIFGSDEPQQLFTNFLHGSVPFMHL